MESRVTVERCDCDEAGTVFNLNYLYWFDCAFQRLLRSRGLSQRELKQHFEAVTPLVEAGARFRASVRYDDELPVEARVTEWKDRRFRVGYTLRSGGAVVVEGFALRAWALVGADGRFSGAFVSTEFKDMMS